MRTARLIDLPDVLTVAEAARFLRLGRNTVYEAVRRNELPCVRVGRRLDRRCYGIISHSGRRAASHSVRSD